MLARVASIVLCLFVIAVSRAAEAQQPPPITRAAIEAFLDNAYVSDGDAESWDAIFKRSVPRNHDPETTIAEFSKRIGTGPDLGRQYARVIIDAVAFREMCEGMLARLLCRFQPGMPFHDHAVALAQNEPTGELLIIVGQSLPDNDTSAHIEFAKLARQHGKAGKILALVSHYYGSDYFSAVLMALPVDVPEKAIELSDLDLLPTPESASWQLAFLETAQETARRNGQSVLLQAALAQSYLTIKLELGLAGEAVRDFESYPAEIRSALPVRTRLCDGRLSCEGLQRSAGKFADNLAAAYWVSRGAVPAGLLGQAPALRDKYSAVRAKARHDALAEAISPGMKDEALFSVFLKGPASQDKNGPHYNEDATWRSVMLEATPPIRKAVAMRFRSAGYAKIASHIQEMDFNLFPKNDYGRSGKTIFLAADQFPATARLRQLAWRLRLGLIVLKIRQAEKNQQVSPHVHVTQHKVAWTEKHLPPGIEPWSAPLSDAADPDLPKDLPLPPWSVVRYERVGSEQQVIYSSSDYDMSGEVPAYGYWFQQTKGGAWQKPLYLGLREHFPYVIAQTSKLPLIADGQIQIEVRAREIEPRSITFPPVAMGFKRDEGGLFVSMPLSMLTADTDEDGLTDIEEQRLGLIPDKPDTDGDGMPDGWDPMPLTAIDRQAPRWKQAVGAGILAKLRGHDQGALVITPGAGAGDLGKLLGAAGSPSTAAHVDTVTLVSDPDLFAGLSLPYRLLIYSRADIEAVSTGGAPNLPPEITDVFASLDNHAFYIGWSAGWTGGAFMLTCDENYACKAETLSEWIT